MWEDKLLTAMTFGLGVMLSVFGGLGLGRFWVDYFTGNLPQEVTNLATFIFATVMLLIVSVGGMLLIWLSFNSHTE